MNFSGCLILCDKKKVKRERINKESHEEFQNKNDHFRTQMFFKPENRKKE